MTNNPDSHIFRIIEAASSETALIGRRCFMCGNEPTTGAGEHVLPRWLQKKLALYNERITLMNGSKLPYRQLTVPCCLDCNNGFLRSIENSVIETLEQAEHPSIADRLSIARWLFKILIGLLVKEASLLRDRSDPDKGSIVPPELLQHFFHAQLILQSGRKPTVFEALHGAYPFTLYLYRITESPEFGVFDLMTSVPGQAIAIRMKDFGAILVNDGGLQLHVGPKGPYDLDGAELHPEQFLEVAARVHYKASLVSATHAYSSAETDELLQIIQTAVLPDTSELLSDGSHRIFHEWTDRDCAKWIERYRRFDWGPVFDEETNGLRTILLNEQQQLRDPRRLFSKAA